MKFRLALAAALVLSAAMAVAPANAAVTITTTSFGGANGVHGNGGNQNGTSVGGNVNNADKLGLTDAQAAVTFSSSSSLNLNGGGEATVTGSMGNLDVLFGTGWDSITFAFQNLKAYDLSHFTLAVTDSSGVTNFNWPSCSICEITGKGENKFTVNGSGITNLAFSFDPSIGTAKQFRVELGSGTVPGVPEPATWAMLIMGFGAVGGMMRVRQRKVNFAG